MTHAIVLSLVAALYGAVQWHWGRARGHRLAQASGALIAALGGASAFAVGFADCMVK